MAKGELADKDYIKDFEVIELDPDEKHGLVRFTRDGQVRRVGFNKNGSIDRRTVMNNNPNWNTKGKTAELPVDFMDKQLWIIDAMRDWGRPNWSDPNEIEERLRTYFGLSAEAGLKPTCSGMAMALGTTRVKIFEYRKGVGKPSGCVPESIDVLVKYYNYMEVIFESAFQEGKMPPVVGIFIGKNNYDYRDTVETVLTPNNPIDNVASKEELAKRYLEDMGHYLEEKSEE